MDAHDDHSFIREPWDVVPPMGLEPFELPIHCHFRGRGHHTHSARGEFDADALMAAFPEQTISSHVTRESKPGAAATSRTRRVLIRPEADLFVLLDGPTLTVFGNDIRRAEEQLGRLVALCGVSQDPGPCFQVLALLHGSIDALPVPMTCPFVLREEDLALHYGADFPVWEQRFLNELSARRSGISLLRGPPGTGKTSYLRHLVWKLRSSHRFLYLPVSCVGLLSNPALTEFWVLQSRLNPNLRTVVILEDAESILESRHPENQSCVSNLLNLGDGLLGDVLTLQIICTLNCAPDDIDKAILRPGRLVAVRTFHRLNRAEAERIAHVKALQLTPSEDYSLAEIYHSGSLGGQESAGRCIGFSSSL